MHARSARLSKHADKKFQSSLITQKLQARYRMLSISDGYPEKNAQCNAYSHKTARQAQSAPLCHDIYIPPPLLLLGPWPLPRLRCAQ